jgi:hypothetical protein
VFLPNVFLEIKNHLYGKQNDFPLREYQATEGPRTGSHRAKNPLPSPWVLRLMPEISCLGVWFNLFGSIQKRLLKE